MPVTFGGSSGIVQHFGVGLSQLFSFSIPAGTIQEQPSDVHTVFGGPLVLPVLQDLEVEAQQVDGISNCKYESVRRAARRYGLREAMEGDDWTLFWTDCSVSLDRVKDMKRYLKINHFPGMSEICRKDLLARNLNRMLKLFPKDYSIFPRTWCLPADYSNFQAFTRAKKNKTYICKPDAGCQGKGIFLTKSSRDIQPGEHMICQVYVSRPFIIDGYKFDLRIYVLVTSCEPFSIFMFKEGLARFCTTKYNDPTHSNVVRERPGWTHG